MTCKLYVKVELPGAAVVSIPLYKVKRTTGLKFACGQWVEQHIWGGAITIDPLPDDGDPVITLQIEGRGDYLLADWPHAVAVTVSDRLFWLQDGRWCLVPDHTAIEARSLVEARYCSDTYDLPG